MSVPDSANKCHLYCGVVVLAPEAMEQFIGQTMTDFAQGGSGNHPVLSVLVGARSEAQAVAVLKGRTTLEFPAEHLRDVRLCDVTASFARVRAGGWLDETNWGDGAVRVPPVYLCVDGKPETTDDAMRFVRELFTE